MPLYTTPIEARPGYRLYLWFNNSAAVEVILLGELWGEMFEPLSHGGALYVLADADSHLPKTAQVDVLRRAGALR